MADAANATVLAAPQERTRRMGGNGVTHSRLIGIQNIGIVRIDSISFAFLAWMRSSLGQPVGRFFLFYYSLSDRRTRTLGATSTHHPSLKPVLQNHRGCGRIIDEDGSMRRFPPYHGEAIDCNYIDKLAARIIAFRNSPGMRNERAGARPGRARWATSSNHPFLFEQWRRRKKKTTTTTRDRT